MERGTMMALNLFPWQQRDAYSRNQRQTVVGAAKTMRVIGLDPETPFTL
jgi:hypothetical protein